MKTVFGIDGCKYGWLVAVKSENTNVDLWLINSLDQLPSMTKQPIVAGIDIPLVLHKNGFRLAEYEARGLLHLVLAFRLPTVNFLKSPQ